MVRSRHFSTLTVSALALVALVASGCSSATIESVCNKCSKASSDCVKDLTETEKLAKSKGCEEQFQAVLDCGDEKGTCDSSGEFSGDACAAEVIAVAVCADK